MPIGFHTEIERTDPDYLSDQRDPYSIHRGKYVEVVTPGCAFFGMYVGTTKQEAFVLCPSVCNGNNRYYLENERPTLVSAATIVGLKPLTKDDLQGKIKEQNKKPSNKKSASNTKKTAD